MPVVDLVLEAGLLYDAERGAVIAGGCAAVVAGGRIIASGQRSSIDPTVLAAAARTFRFGEDAMLTPGLIDLHCHVDPTGLVSRYGLDPDEHYLPRGVTTVLSQGDAGSATWAAYSVAVQGCHTRCLMAMNILSAGESPNYFAAHPDGKPPIPLQQTSAARAAQHQDGSAAARR